MTKNIQHILTLIFVSSVVFVATMLINTKTANDREEEYLEEMRVFKEQSEYAIHYADSIQKESMQHQIAAQEAQVRANRLERASNRSKAETGRLLDDLDSLKRIISDSVEMARVIIPKQDSIIVSQDSTIRLQDTRIVFLTESLVQKDSALIKSNVRGDSLYNIVVNIPEPPPPPRIPKIKGSTMFIAGVVITTVVHSIFRSRR